MNGLPEVLARREHDGGIELELRVGADCPWFVGHFPERSILPGVVQIGWAAWFAAQWGGREAPPTILRKVKFKHPVGPGARLVLRLQAVGDGLQFEYLLILPGSLETASNGTLEYVSVA